MPSCNQGRHAFLIFLAFVRYSRLALGMCPLPDAGRRCGALPTSPRPGFAPLSNESLGPSLREHGPIINHSHGEGPTFKHQLAFERVGAKVKVHERYDFFLSK